ncbi:MAG: hypothetical protein AB8H79_08225 [Myxococcota bacterium]
MRALLRRLSLLILVACQGLPTTETTVEVVGDRVLERVSDEAAPAESEGHPVWRVRQTLPDGRRLVQDAEGIFLDEEQVGADPISAVAIRGSRFVFADRLDGDPVSKLVVCGERCRTLVTVGHPDRVALSEDGEMVAYVAGSHGLPAIFVSPFAGGEARQLTNAGLHRHFPGKPPGFVPPPQDGPLRFEGSELVWVALGQEHRVGWK